MSAEDKVPSPDGVGVVPEPEPETVRRRPKWLAPVAAGCVLVLLAVGGVAGYRMWSARELAEAKEACAVGSWQCWLSLFFESGQKPVKWPL